MSVLITGGSGFLGINLIRYFHGQGVGPLTSLDIAPFDYPAEDQARVETVLGDIRDQATVDRLVAGKRWVVHCAAALPLCTPEEIHETDAIGTRNLLEAAARHGVERFVFISSTAVYGIPDHHPLLETDPVVGVGPYGAAKIEAEGHCEAFRQQGLVVPVIRPKSFIGPERLGIFALLYQWAREGRKFPLLGGGHNRYQLLDVEDLCRAIHACLTQPAEKANQVFNIGAQIFTTMREDFQAVLDVAGFGKRIVGIPIGPAIAAMKVLEKLRLSPLYEWVYGTAAKDSFVSVEKAEQVLGFTPRHSNKDALVRNYRWYLDNLEQISAQKPGVTHRAPWKTGALSLLRYFF